MKKILYLECNAGISGDMSVAALLDLGADQDVLMKALNSIPDQRFKIEISNVDKAAINCKDFNVILDEDNHDHDMEYLHHTHTHEHEHEHVHDGDHVHEHHHHEHTNLAQIKHVLSHVDMSENANKLANKIFTVLAEAEAKAHNKDINDVHFHEVGALDSIVDIVAFSVCFDNLGIDEVIVPYVCEGKGTIRCQHGILPIPVPATSNIVSAYNIPIQFMDVEGEFVTPTGAAIVASVQTSNTLKNTYKMNKIGYGAGKRNYERASILRAMLLEESDVQKDTIMKLECNIDDCSGEVLGYVLDQLFENGARDVNYTPVFMKKNRPAYEIHVICDKDNVETLEDIIFKETTTIGIRKVEMERTILDREIKDVTCDYGTCSVKVCTHKDNTYYYPEYESVKQLSKDNNTSYLEVYENVISKCK